MRRIPSVEDSDIAWLMKRFHVSREEDLTQEGACSICLNDGMLDPINVEPCGHLFCQRCIEEWKKWASRFTCPECRTMITEVKNLPEEQVLTLEKIPLIRKEFQDHA